MTSITGPNGATGTTTYDVFGRPTQTTILDGAQTNYTYGYTGMNGATANQQTATLGSGTGARWKRTTLDGFGRVTRVEAGHDATTVSQVDTQFAPCACSPLGKLWRTSQPYAPGGTPVWTTNTYDASGRTLTVTAPDGSVTHYSYAGNQTTLTDAAGKWKTSVSDAFGNLVQVVEPNPDGGANLTTNYTYNSLNQLVQVSMPRSNGTQTRTFAYSGADMVSATNPENGTVTYQYDASHHVTQRTDAIGQQTRYLYDVYGRLTQVQHWAGSPLAEQTNQRWTYTYDANPLDGAYSQNTWGRLAAVQFNQTAVSAAMSYQYSYNQAGRVTKQRMTNSQLSLALDMTAAYTWDNEGRMTSLAYPRNGPVYNYGFDAMGRLGSMTNGATTVATATYGVASELQNLTYDGYSETRTYNSLLQLTQMTSTLGMNMQYLYPTGQNNGRITQSIDGVAGETVNYTYDTLNRLASATATNGSWGQGFSYDGFGNLTGKTATAGAAPTLSVAFDAATNHQVGMMYDGNGNSFWGSVGGLPTSGYDVENRMANQYLDGLWMNYTYDPKGKRVTKGNVDYVQDTGSEEFYFYGIGGQKLTTVTCTINSPDGTFTCTDKTNVYFGGKLIRSNGLTVATDRLGSVRANASGERMSYYPYGEEKTSTADGREKFGTYFRDSTTQDYADQRYYAVGTGRFFTADPYIASGGPGDTGSWNRYAYVGGDPINFMDRGGNCKTSPDDEDENPDPCQSGPPQKGKEVPKQENPDGPHGTGSPTPSSVYTAAVFSALAALQDPGCAGIFNTNPNAANKYSPADVLAAMVFGGTPTGIPDGSYFGTVQFSGLRLNVSAVTQPDPATVVSTGNGGMQALSANIVLQSSKLSDNYYGGLYASDVAMVLVHELGHVYNIVSGLGGSSIVFDSNPDGSPNADAEDKNAKTLQKCHFQ